MDRKLIEYLPEFMRDFREIRFLTDKQQEQAEKLWVSLDTIWNNQFIETLDEDGCARWERMLKIHNKDTYTLPERRNKILSKMVEQRPFTMKSLRKTLTMLCGADGYSVELASAEYILKVRIALASKNMYNDVKELVDKIVPANLIVDADLMYNQYGKVGGFPHAQLTAYTHEQLRSEVI